MRRRTVVPRQQHYAITDREVGVDEQQSAMRAQGPKVDPRRAGERVQRCIGTIVANHVEQFLHPIVSGRPLPTAAKLLPLAGFLGWHCKSRIGE